MDSKNQLLLLEKAKNTDDNSLLIQIAATFLGEGFYKDAVNVLKKVDESTDYIFQKNYCMGLLCKAQGNLDDAIKHFGIALRANPDYSQLYPLTAAACFQNGMTEEGDKLMIILKGKDHFFFQHVAAIVEAHRTQKN